MQKPTWSWNNTMARLGLNSQKKQPHRHRPKPRRLQLEPLEGRHLLAAGLDIPGACDNSDLEFATLGADWVLEASESANRGDFYSHAAGTGQSMATWTFTDLQVGQSYEVFAIWVPQTDGATNAPFRVRDSSQSEGTVWVDQTGASSEIRVQSLGNFKVDSGTLVVELSDDADGRVIADAVAIFQAPDAIQTDIVDNGEAAYLQTGDAWLTKPEPDAYGGDVAVHLPGKGLNTAAWTLGNLRPGREYEVFATWVPQIYFANNVPYTVSENSAVKASVRVNQRLLPNDRTIDGHAWESLGVYTVDRDSLTVEISDDANGQAVADAIQVVEVGSVRRLTAPEQVTLGGQITLTAEVLDPSGRAVEQMAFYRDVDRDGRLDPRTDQLLGTDTSGLDGWSWLIPTAKTSEALAANSLPRGDYTFFAQSSSEAGTIDYAAASVAVILGGGGPAPLEGGGPAAVVARHIFYNNSYWDDPAESHDDNDAIAPDKTALLPGQNASFVNYTSYQLGINGVMVDIQDLPEPATIDVNDFLFRVGNDTTPADWTTVATIPTLTVDLDPEGDDPDRVKIIWADSVIEKEWLQVTVLANAQTGLLIDDIFYFGNAIGETGDRPLDAIVDDYDVLDTRNNPHPFFDPALIDCNYDFNRDERVDAIDVLICQNNPTTAQTALQLISAPGIVGRHVFYNNSYFDGDDPLLNADDDDAVAPDKTALLPGQTASFANLTSYYKGIYGIMIDFYDLEVTPTAADFQFRVGNDFDPNGWDTLATTPSITLREDAGDGGSDRVTILWSETPIVPQWVQVTVLPTASTGLPAADVFYFGNLPGDTNGTDPDEDGYTEVDISDVMAILASGDYPSSDHPIDYPFDFNRDTDLNPADIDILDDYFGKVPGLALLTAPQPDIVMTGFATSSNHNQFEVSYRIDGADASPFHIGIYRSSDGIHPDAQLMSYEVTYPYDLSRSETEHTVSFSPDFVEAEEDYYLMAVADVYADVPESDEFNNQYLFEGGIFLSDNSDIVQVHGTDSVDLVDISVPFYHQGEPTSYTVKLNQDQAIFPTGQFLEFHIRTHDGDDEVRTPDELVNIYVSGIKKEMWVFGGDGGDVILGSDEDDRLYGGDGDDEIVGRMGDDRIYGEAGDDRLEGIDGVDTIYGGAGDDYIEGWEDDDKLYGDWDPDDPQKGTDDGDDTIHGHEGNDEIYGGLGNDRIDGGDGDDEIYGDYEDPTEDDGDDEIYGWEGDDQIHGGGGHDNLFGENGDDTIYGDDGDDMLKAGPGSGEEPPVDGGNGTDFDVDNQDWPDDLPWPELNLVVEVGSDRVIDDDGGLIFGYASEDSWEFDIYNENAVNEAQSACQAEDIGENGATWMAPVWTDDVSLWVTWDRDLYPDLPYTFEDNAEAVTFTVGNTDGAVLETKTFDQTKGVDEQEIDGVDQPYITTDPPDPHSYVSLNPLDESGEPIPFELSDHKGLLYVTMTVRRAIGSSPTRC